ncbi:D-3-phosphoglycerate dehydrogenase [Murinocardiopsis flavida]|uniref:D-3-phosphoglycerate dehydrogenase n=1 Tax=Murinocardiopsis flavida TaxID=645275 RepID=A0A2P8DQ09_9ACTN|nr:2-hydroxyacid dehydrogenase [Murinocardiopsis flavida]PSK99317.1 D-3-phosphoglycerate dehydrogenase [Murinocardiopsis flavida]
MKILTAGDHFVTNGLLADALHDRLGAPFDHAELTLPWPHTPFGPVGEVQEASDAEDALIAALPGVRVAVTQMAPFTERALDAADALELLVCCRGGPVNVNLAAAAARGIAVVATPGRNATAAAEHTVALLLAAKRAVPRTHAGLAAGQWRSDLYAYGECGTELGGSTVGLIGYGAIGRKVARVLHAFDARVLVHDPYTDPADAGPHVELTGLDELLAQSTAVSLHARLTPETAGLVDAARIAAMPPGAVLVNTARGGLLDYPAAAAALVSGHLGAAGFDVFDSEPLAADSPLRSAPNVVMTPHLAGATRETAHRAARLSAEAVADHLAGRTPQGLVPAAAR